MKNSTVQAVRETPVSATPQKKAGGSDDRLHELKTRIGERLNQLSVALMARLSDRMVSRDDAQPDDLDATLQDRIRLLGQLASGLAIAPAELLPEVGAGYGSMVSVEEAESKSQSRYLLMVGSLVDIDAGQVSLASPIGQALLGRTIGETVTVELPQRELRLRVIEVVTLSSFLDSLELLRTD